MKRKCIFPRGWRNADCKFTTSAATCYHYTPTKFTKKRLQWNSPFAGKWSESHSVKSNSLRPHGLYSPWNSPGQNTGAGSLSLLWGIFPTQGLNPGLLHCRRILYQLSHNGSSRETQWSEWLSSESLQVTDAREGVEKREPSHTVDGNVNWYSVEVPQKTQNRNIIWSNNPTPGHIPGQNRNSQGYVHPYLHIGWTIHNCQHMETT